MYFLEPAATSCYLGPAVRNYCIDLDTCPLNYDISRPAEALSSGPCQLVILFHCLAQQNWTCLIFRFSKQMRSSSCPFINFPDPIFRQITLQSATEREKKAAWEAAVNSRYRPLQMSNKTNGNWHFQINHNHAKVSRPCFHLFFLVLFWLYIEF